MQRFLPLIPLLLAPSLACGYGDVISCRLVLISEAFGAELSLILQVVSSPKNRPLNLSIYIIPLLTLSSFYSTNASGAEQTPETNNSNQT